jgi:hypothetical protein
MFFSWRDQCPVGMGQVREWRCGFDDCDDNHHILCFRETVCVCVCVCVRVCRLSKFRVQFYGARL